MFIIHPKTFVFLVLWYLLKKKLMISFIYFYDCVVLHVNNLSLLNTTVYLNS